ncbi:MAG TPA: hypothetical protein VLT33_09650 [Labilithrix sp.]|nr:hypothetical protein [Labilithrix sp.]
MIGTVVVALVLAAIALVLAWATVHLSLRARRAQARLSRMAALTTSAISEIASGPVEVVGVAVPIDAGSLLEAPLSGTRCVWWRVTIDRDDGSSRTNVSTTSAARDFHLDDGSGALARVRTEHAKVELAARVIDPAHRDAAARLLAKLGIEEPLDRLLWREERIDPRAELHVLGRATVAPAPGAGGPFRPQAPRERAVIDAPEGGELVVGFGDEQALAAELEASMRDARRIARPFAVLALGFLVAFLAVVYEGLLAG